MIELLKGEGEVPLLCPICEAGINQTDETWEGGYMIREFTCHGDGHHRFTELWKPVNWQQEEQ
jgi:hypothetical protein